MVELEAIRRRVDEATAGPWIGPLKRDEPWNDRAGITIARDLSGLTTQWAETKGSNASANATFIAHARTDVPALCDEVERLRALLANRDLAERGKWQDISTAPRERGRDNYYDLWIVDRKYGRQYREADCYYAPHEGKDAWANRDGKWITGARYWDADEGDECFDPTRTDETSRVATHWQPLPAPPLPHSPKHRGGRPRCASLARGCHMPSL